jgi:hypothetical protein
MLTSSSGTAASTIARWDGEVVAGFGVDAGTVGDSGVQVDTCNGTVGVVRGLAATESGGGVPALAATESDSFRSAFTTGLVSSVGLRLGLNAGDELGGVAGVGAGGGVLGLAATESINSFRSVLRTGVVDSTGLRVGVDADAAGELGTVGCAGTSEGVSVFTEPVTGVAAGDEVVACAGIGDVVPTLAGTESGGARVGVTAAGGGDSAELRLGVDAAGELETVGCAGTSDGVSVFEETASGVAAGDGVVVAAGGGVAPVLAGIASGLTAGDRILVAADTGPVGADSVLAGGTESGNTVRGGLREGVGASAGPRVEVDAGDERETASCAGAGGAVPIFAETESGVVARDGVGTVACAGTAGAVPVLTGPETGVTAKDGVGVAAWAGIAGGVPVLAAGTESGNTVRGALGERIGVASGPRVGVDAEDERGTVPCVGAGGVAAVLAETVSGVAVGDGVGVEVVART